MPVRPASSQGSLPEEREDDDGIPRAQEADLERLSLILFGHSAFQCLNAACELGLFELLASSGPLTAQEVGDSLGLADRATDILLLGCTALGLTRKNADQYRVAPVITWLMEQGEWQHLRNTVAFEQHIVYPGQVDFTEALRRNTNAGLRRIPGEGADLYRRIAAQPRLEQVFYRYMRSWSQLANGHLVETLDLSATHRLLDCGGGEAVNAIALARANPELRVTVLDLPSAATLARKRIEEADLAERISVVAADMFTAPFPEGHDCVLFAHQLVIWTPEENTALLRKAHAALPPGGRVVVFNSMSHDSGEGPLVAALDSVYFASLPAEGGMIYPWRLHEECLRAAGFAEVRRHACPGWTPHGILVASKPPA
ncbi:methyltransferase [Wenjunlia vitaminophila]|uniref:Methyltransferase n=1 Tax=Wenjunlia vitaminophila TaxID=76728 RepID=A0A0T6LUN3_WENVI|nr:methyltransferase [Wenjunlia vitaminophila]KRV49748.1 methyltransferase [Wenjunlia vitaminophila]